MPSVFVSLACAADEDLGDRWNLDRVVYENGGVAGVTSAVNTVYEPGTGDVIAVEIDAVPSLLRAEGTLLQGVHGIRAGYYATVLGYEDEDALLVWSNVLGST